MKLPIDIETAVPGTRSILVSEQSRAKADLKDSLVTLPTKDPSYLMILSKRSVHFESLLLLKSTLAELLVSTKSIRIRYPPVVNFLRTRGIEESFNHRTTIMLGIGGFYSNFCTSSIFLVITSS